MIRRQKLLHSICVFVDQNKKHGKMKSLIRKAATRFNSSILALKRGDVIAAKTMHAHYLRWRAAGKTEAIFAPKWQRPDLKISSAQAVVYAQRMVSEGLSIAELYRRLERERRRQLPFAPCTLGRALPRMELRRLRAAQSELTRATLAFRDALNSMKGAA
jgi:hypothetical protein